MDSTEECEESIGKALQSQFDDAVTPLKENPMSEFIRKEEYVRKYTIHP